MSEETTGNEYRLAPMSPLISALTIVLLALPVGFLLATLAGARQLAIAAVFVSAVYTWVWLRFRPVRFRITRTGLEIVWPLKRREIPLADISNVRVLDSGMLRTETGWRYRIGAGGLWGVFGWLKTERRGIVQTYISRFDGLVWIECTPGRPWLISPERPEAFASALIERITVRP